MEEQAVLTTAADLADVAGDKERTVPSDDELAVTGSALSKNKTETTKQTNARRRRAWAPMVNLHVTKF
jgi:hypothetical protein